MAANPKPKTIALLAEDAEFPKNASEGVRDHVKTFGLQMVYDKTYPPGTPDFTPIVHAIQATNPDMVFVASYPPGLGRHAARGNRKRAQDPILWRRHGRVAVHHRSSSSSGPSSTASSITIGGFRRRRCSSPGFSTS